MDFIEYPYSRKYEYHSDPKCVDDFAVLQFKYYLQGNKPGSKLAKDNEVSVYTWGADCTFSIQVLLQEQYCVSILYVCGYFKRAYLLQDS